jgi:hypothetical protein
MKKKRWKYCYFHFNCSRTKNNLIKRTHVRQLGLTNVHGRAWAYVMHKFDNNFKGVKLQSLPNISKSITDREKLRWSSLFSINCPTKVSIWSKSYSEPLYELRFCCCFEDFFRSVCCTRTQMPADENILPILPAVSTCMCQAWWYGKPSIGK